MDIAKQLLLQLLLIMLNAFFAATEIAVISLNEKKVKARADGGDKKAATMLRMIEEPTRFLSTIQIGITLAGFLGSAFAADNFAERLSGAFVTAFDVEEKHIGAVNTVSVIVITLILSFFTLVLGELVPKRIAMKHKEKLAERVCGIIAFLAGVLRPVIWLLTVTTNGVLRLFGIGPEGSETPVSEEDIVIMLDAGADEGSLDQNNVEYIKNVFKLDRLTVADVMTQKKDIVSVSRTQTDRDITEIISEMHYSRMPVYSGEQDEILGILHARDYLLKHGRKDFAMEQAMTAAEYVPESMHLDVLLKDMQTEHTHMVVVINEYGEASGIVTMEDIIEELVGEIWDETDEETTSITENGDGSYNVECKMSTEDFFEFFGVKQGETSEANTVNGWVIEQVGDIPENGCSFDYDKLVIQVLEADELMAHVIQVRVMEDSEVAASETSAE